MPSTPVAHTRVRGGVRAQPRQIKRARSGQAVALGSQPSIIATHAHELRNPLMALATSCELISESLQTLSVDEARAMLEAVHRRIVWLNDLVDSLVGATTSLTSLDELECQELRMFEVLSDTYLVVSPLLIQTRQRLRIRGAERVSPFVADRQRIAQVLINLITNAAKFSPNESTIDVRCVQLDHSVRIEVSDRGPGIAASRVAQLFEPFVRSASSANGTNNGVGLGLAYVKLIVEAHGGTVGANARNGGGSRFWVMLPQMAHSQRSGEWSVPEVQLPISPIGAERQVLPQ